MQWMGTRKEMEERRSGVSTVPLRREVGIYIYNYKFILKLANPSQLRP